MKRLKAKVLNSNFNARLKKDEKGDPMAQLKNDAASLIGDVIGHC